MSDAHTILVVPGTETDEEPLDDAAALEAALADLARGFVRLREEGR